MQAWCAVGSTGKPFYGRSERCLRAYCPLLGDTENTVRCLVFRRERSPVLAFPRRKKASNRCRSSGPRQGAVQNSMADAPFGARFHAASTVQEPLRLRLAVSDEAAGRSRVAGLSTAAVSCGRGHCCLRFSVWICKSALPTLGSRPPAYYCNHRVKRCQLRRPEICPVASWGKLPIRRPRRSLGKCGPRRGSYPAGAESEGALTTCGSRRRSHLPPVPCINFGDIARPRSATGVVRLVRKERILLMNQAVFAPAAGALLDETAESGWHSMAHGRCAAARMRALTNRISRSTCSNSGGVSS